MHSTNYYDTLILISPDCASLVGGVPAKEESVAARQHHMITAAPYRWTSDDVIFTVFADRKGIEAAARSKAREAFFSKGQPCFRASALVKTYGWGVHSDVQGRLGVFGVETAQYQALVDDENVKKISGMRSRRL